MLFLIGFSCSGGSEAGETEYKELEYLGYKFYEGKVSVFLKNYSNTNYLVTVNSLSPENEIVDKEISELIFLNSQNKDSSLKIKNNIDTEERVFSKALVNPELNSNLTNYRKYNERVRFRNMLYTGIVENCKVIIMSLAIS